MDDLKFNTLYENQCYFDVLIRDIYNGFIPCPFLLQTFCIGAPNKKLPTIHFHTLNVVFAVP